MPLVIVYPHKFSELHLTPHKHNFDPELTISSNLEHYKVYQMLLCTGEEKLIEQAVEPLSPATKC